MTTSRWPDLPMLGAAELPSLAGGVDRILWPGLITLAQHLPAEHVVIGGVMVYLHGAAAGRVHRRVTRDVDVLFDLQVAPGSLRQAVQVLTTLRYRADPSSPDDSTHRYHGPSGESVDILAPAGLRPKPDLTTTPPGHTIEVYGGQSALRHRVLVEVRYDGDRAAVPVPDLPRALCLKCIAFRQHQRQRPAQAFTSRHLGDIAFLTSLVEDPDDLLAQASDERVSQHLEGASALDDPDHRAWAVTENRAEAHLIWQTIRQL